MTADTRVASHRCMARPTTCRRPRLLTAAPDATIMAVPIDAIPAQEDFLGGLDNLAEALFNQSTDAILAADREGIIIFWNPGAERIFGFTAVQAVGQSLDMIVPEALRARHGTGYMQTMATGTTRYGAGDLLSVPALTRDGRRISVEFSIVLLRDQNGLPAGTAAILRDVTARFAELKALRQAAAASR